MRVLLIDDNTSLHRLMRIAVAPHGIVVEAVDSASAALRFFGEGGQVDIVLLDFSMPRRDGLSLLPDLRKVCAVPIVLFTGNPIYLETYRDYFDGTIDKGDKIEQILATLHRLTGDAS